MSDPLSSPDLLDRPGAARMCGVAESTIEWQRRRYRFPQPEKFGSQVRWRRSDLDLWLAGKRDWRPPQPFEGRPHFRMAVPSAARAAAVSRRLLRYGFCDFSTIPVGPQYAVLLGVARGDPVQTAADLRVFVPDLRFVFHDATGEPADLATYAAKPQEPAADFLE